MSLLEQGGPGEQMYANGGQSGWRQTPYPAPGMPPTRGDPRRFGRVGIVPWTLRQTVLGTAITLVPWMTFIVFTAASGASSAASNVKLPRVPRSEDLVLAVVTLVISAVIECAFIIAPLYYAARTRPPGAPLSAGLRALGFRRAPLGLSAALVIGGVFVTLAVSYLYGLIVEIFNLPLKTNAQALQDQAASMPLTVLATLIVAVVVAPFCEEIFFRGYLFSGLLHGMALWPAVIVSAVLFTASHGDVGSAAPILVLGLLLALVRWRTGSIWPGMALHMANNLLAALVIIATLIHP